MKVQDSLRDIVALCKRRGFIYPGSELYGGFANTYSFGPYGAQLKKQIKDLWWQTFVQQRSDMLGLDGPILLHPKVWQASGHEAGFSDALIDCRACKSRFRVDALIEEALQIDVEGHSLTQLDQIIAEKALACPKCKARDFTNARHFNLMFQTNLGKTSEASERTYLRPETAQAIFLDYKNILDTTRARIPFGIAQIGKAFRNEITPGNFLFRQIEFEQMEIEYFIHPGEWQTHFEEWLESMQKWCAAIGLPETALKLYEHERAKLSHYSRRTVDIQFEFPFGWSELFGLAYRGDYDLAQHAEASGKNLEYIDPVTKARYLPHVVEPTFGLDRCLLAVLCAAFEKQEFDNGESRCVLHLEPKLAPVQCAIFPLMSKPHLKEIAQDLYVRCQKNFLCEFDDSGSIGKRYRRQDELGTPYCLTVDYQTLEDQTVTLRERDTMKQVRIALDGVAHRISEMIRQ